MYDEDEFFSDAVGDERFGSTISDAGEGRTRRLAGAAMLLSAVGAVGGLVVVNSLPPVKSAGRQTAGGLRAEGGDSPVPRHVASARDWAALTVSVRPRRARRRGIWPVGRRLRQGGRERRPEVLAERPYVGVPGMAAADADGTRLAMSMRGIVRTVARPEFGFER